MARFDYIGCEFRYFWRNLSLDSLRDYAVRLEHVFQEKDRSDGFSSEEFLQALQNNLEHYDPYSKYRFDFHGSGSCETWQIRFPVTQIPHIEGGVVQSSSLDQNRLRFGHSLLDHGVANYVEVNEFAKPKGINRLIPKLIAGAEVGSGIYLYVWHRVRKIPALHQKLYWDGVNSNNFNFSGFLEHMSGALESTHSSVVELHYGEGINEVTPFMERSDDLLLANLDGAELCRLFDLIELSPYDWFAAARSG